ncbi:MAG: DUF3050 domain-containing protein, partial [Hymenobacteraceae bacterium]|nr:DUF3050 domain-containing protein [Hymenobacteraceae bacterium]MDX5395914.1 DUF3050 domain-containing protein [Hymenobacteraceae bacterium]MDX5511971.1 DUF3050 domain-containing protein [Hymenobacteraceae bacterium]
MSDHIQTIQKELAPYRKKLLEHPIYQNLHDLPDLRVFMEHHVFAVWDFMSLLKALQRELTCVTVPWFPKGAPVTRRLINELVLEEETDIDENGTPLSHFELYLNAMDAAGANSSAIKEIWHATAAGKSLDEALTLADVPEEAREFIKHTFEIIDGGKVYEIAAAFTFGREEVIPDMFQRLVHSLYNKFPEEMGPFAYYLDRHLQIDEEVHMPLAFEMMTE